jgi:hypothetical protein
VHQYVEQIVVRSPLRSGYVHPLLLFKKDRDPGCGKRIAKLFSLLQRLLKSREREARVEGNKCSFRIFGRQIGISLPTRPLKFVPQNLDQASRIVTTGHTDNALPIGEALEFSRQVYVPVKQHKEFGFSSRVVTVKGSIASKHGQHILRRDLLTNTGHAKERSQRTWNYDRIV